MKKFALNTLVLAMSAMTTITNAGYINTAIPSPEFEDTVWENGITPNSRNNPHVVDNAYYKDGSDTDSNRVAATDINNNETTVAGVNSALITGFSNTLTDVAAAVVDGVKNEISNVSVSNIVGMSNKINGMMGGAVFGVWNNVETKHGDEARSVFVVGSYNDIKSGANAFGRNIEIDENSSGANAFGNRVNIASENAVAIGDDTNVSAQNSVALGKGSVADREQSVSIGSAGDERQIINVKAGTELTDAVNVSQLQTAKTEMTTLINNAGTKVAQEIARIDAANTAQDTAIAQKADKTYVDSKNAEQDKTISDIQAKNNTQDTLIAQKADTSYVDSKMDELHGAIAGSVAIAMMPTATKGIKMISAGIGSSGGQSALAVGFTGTSTNGKYSFKIGTSYATKGGATFGAGFGYSF